MTSKVFTQGMYIKHTSTNTSHDMFVHVVLVIQYASFVEIYRAKNEPFRWKIHYLIWACFAKHKREILRCKCETMSIARQSLNSVGKKTKRIPNVVRYKIVLTAHDWKGTKEKRKTKSVLDAIYMKCNERHTHESRTFMVSTVHIDNIKTIAVKLWCSSCFVLRLIGVEFHITICICKLARGFCSP